ncbi:SPOR domain-containing protein [Cloacibacterium rupense]|nr:SPOR domain-containing protein [Cloacibacterium rupense]
MNKILKGISFFVLMGFYTVDAQEVVKKDTLKGTVLTMTMDSKVEGLLSDLEEKCDRMNELESKPTTKVVVNNKPKTTEEICRDNPRIMGFRIQVAVVKSNEESNEVKAYFRSKFPNIKAITDASLRPNYKILAGSYFTKQSASADLARIKQYFKEARAVEYYIFCQEGK